MWTLNALLGVWCLAYGIGLQMRKRIRHFFSCLFHSCVSFGGDILVDDFIIRLIQNYTHFRTVVFSFFQKVKEEEEEH